MKFNKAEITEAYPAFRATSENNIWEIGIIANKAFRVSGGKVGVPVYEFNYWCGKDQGVTMGVMGLVSAILEKISEDISVQEFRDVLPKQNIRPMIDDHECWDALVAASK